MGEQVISILKFVVNFRTADSKLNNFTRLEPTLHLLEVTFDTNTAHGVMQEQSGVATRLMYQLYIALNNKRQSNLTGVAMETMRAQAPVKLESLERGPYKDVSWASYCYLLYSSHCFYCTGCAPWISNYHYQILSCSKLYETEVNKLYNMHGTWPNTHQVHEGLGPVSAKVIESNKNKDQDQLVSLQYLRQDKT